ncbi:hypothetical protein MMC10_011126 [Thelotrema lepadinum]|nr:hypothetical protein [Thelotrema lepadinum]
MAELLGVAAAAVQLAGCCESLLKALRTIRCASCTIRRYRHQLEDLESLCCSLQENSLLCTTEIESQISSIHSSLANYIEKKLGKRRVWYWVRYFIVRDEFAEFFRTLEEKKSSLALSINNVIASAVCDIRSDVRIMCGTSPIKPSEETETHNSKRFVRILEHRASPTHELTIRFMFSREDIAYSSPWSPQDSGYESALLQREKSETAPQPDMKNGTASQSKMAESTAKTVYKRQDHAGRGEQVNGPEVNEMPSEPLENLTKDTEYRENVKRASKCEGAGQGEPGDSQLNGPNFATGALAEKSAGVYEKNRMEGNGPQYNGPRIGQKK